jgi:hypothetical protein
MVTHSSRRKSLDLIKESLQVNKADNYVGFYKLFILQFQLSFLYRGNGVSVQNNSTFPIILLFLF